MSPAANAAVSLWQKEQSSVPSVDSPLNPLLLCLSMPILSLSWSIYQMSLRRFLKQKQGLLNQKQRIRQRWLMYAPPVVSR